MSSNPPISPIPTKNNSFVKDFWINFCTLKHWKTSYPDFCSHPVDLEYYNTFITDFWIYLGILDYWKTSNTDFCSHPGDLKYYNTFKPDFWISKALEDF